MTGALVGLVLAFTTPVNFQAPAQYGGGSGNRFTGSPSSHWNCGACHVADPALRVEVKADGRDLHAAGYVPGETVTLEVTLSEPSKASAFALELVDAKGETAGTLALPPPPMGSQTETFCPDGFTSIVELVDGAKVVQSSACREQLAVWRVAWTAPDADVGAVTVYVSAVAGDGDGTNLGDRSAARVLGVPSPGTPKATGCSCAPGPTVLALLALAALLRPRRAGARVSRARVRAPRAPRLLGLLVLGAALVAPGAVDAKTRAKKKKRKPPVTKPVVTPEPEPEPPAPEPAAPPAETTAAPPPVGPAPPPAPAAPPVTVETFQHTARDTSAEPVAFELHVGAGAGLRRFHLATASVAPALGVSLQYPEASVGFTAYPLRLLGAGAGLQLEGAYQVGWAFNAQVSNADSVAPSDGWLTLGWNVALGPVELAPRALWRLQVGGVERNAQFDDGWFQSAGGELAVRARVGAVVVELRPRGGVVFDAGTVPTRGYGALTGGVTYGGLAQAGLTLGQSPWRVSLAYGYSHTEVRFAGGGERQLDAVTFTDTTQSVQLSLAAEL